MKIKKTIKYFFSFRSVVDMKNLFLFDHIRLKVLKKTF